jgi:hypothetical protein
MGKVKVVAMVLVVAGQTHTNQKVVVRVLGAVNLTVKHVG